MHNEIFICLCNSCTASYTGDANQVFSPSFLILLLFCFYQIFFFCWEFFLAQSNCQALLQLILVSAWSRWSFHLLALLSSTVNFSTTVYAVFNWDYRFFFFQQVHLAMKYYCIFPPAVLWFVPMPYCSSL